MSILSSEEMFGRLSNVRVIEKTNAIEIEISEPKPTQSISTGNTIQVTLPEANIDERYIIHHNNGAFNNVVINNGYNVINNSYSVSSYHTVGFRLFIKNGYLRCIRKEISDLTLLTSAAEKIRDKIYETENSFAHVGDIAVRICDESLMDKIQDKILSFAKRKGVTVPEKFVRSGHAYHGVTVYSYRSALDWLAYPLVRELDSIAFCKGLSYADKNTICPDNRATCVWGFKKLVEFYYGTSTTKMLEETWKALTVGSEIKRTVFGQDLSDSVRDIEIAKMRHIEEPIEVRGNEVISVGNRFLNSNIFTLGPAIFKTLGFDHLYRWLSTHTNETNGLRPTYSVGASQAYETHLGTLLNYISKKKLISILCSDKESLHYIFDTTRMLLDYPNASEIPISLKDQFPNGIEVNFKFKTMKELHDKISAQYTIIESEANKKEIPIHPTYMVLNGMQKNGLKLVVPTNTTHLSVWGKLLNICIASYGDRAAAAETLILGVEKNGEIKYCIEFHSTILCMVDPASLPIATFGRFDDPSSMIEPKTIRVALPLLTEKPLGIVPEDVQDDVYLAPAIVQFRACRNGDPDPQDENDVNTMLSNWVLEFQKDLHYRLGDKVMASRGGIYNGNYDNVNIAGNGIIFGNEFLAGPNNVVVNNGNNYVVNGVLA